MIVVSTVCGDASTTTLFTAATRNDVDADLVTVCVTSVVCCKAAVFELVVARLDGTRQAGVTYIVVGRYTVWIEGPATELVEAGDVVAGAATTATCGSKRTESGYVVVVGVEVSDSVCVTVTLYVIVVSA